jgi:hypothetical protein
MNTRRKLTGSAAALSVLLIQLLTVNHAIAGQPQMNFQAQTIQCIDGFNKTKQTKDHNGMVTKMVCKTPVITCPKNTTLGIDTLAIPKLNKFGGGDRVKKFRFVYTCMYYDIEG